MNMRRSILAWLTGIPKEVLERLQLGASPFGDIGVDENPLPLGGNIDSGVSQKRHEVHNSRITSALAHLSTIEPSCESGDLPSQFHDGVQHSSSSLSDRGPATKPPMLVEVHFAIGSRVVVDGDHQGIVRKIRILTSPMTVIYDVRSAYGHGSLGSFPHFRLREAE